jgi:hypothetical protein
MKGRDPGRPRLKLKFVMGRDALLVLGEDTQLSWHDPPDIDGAPVPNKGDLVHVFINGKSTPFMVIEREFIYGPNETMEVRHTLGTLPR